MRLSFISLILMLYSTVILAVPSQDQIQKDLGLNNTIVFSHVVAKDTPKGKGAERLKQLVEERKNDFSPEKVQVYPDSVLFDDTKVMTALAEKKVQLAAPSISKLLTLNPKLKIFDFPFLFKDVDEAFKFYEAAKDKLFFFPEKVGNDMLWYLDKEKTYIVIELWHGGMKQITSSKTIAVSSDKLDKLLGDTKFRIQSSPVIKSTFEALGASIEMVDDFAKVRKMLKENKIDGQENTWSNIWTEEFYKHQRFFLESNHGYLGYLLITNQQFFDEHLKNTSDGAKWLDVFTQVTDEVNRSQDNATAKENIAALKKDSKTQQVSTENKSEPVIKSLSDDERKKWCEQIYESQYSEWKKLVNEIGKEIVKLAIKGEGKDTNRCPYNQLDKMTK